MGQWSHRYKKRSSKIIAYVFQNGINKKYLNLELGFCKDQKMLLGFVLMHWPHQLRKNSFHIINFFNEWLHYSQSRCGNMWERPQNQRFRKKEKRRSPKDLTFYLKSVWIVKFPKRNQSPNHWVSYRDNFGQIIWLSSIKIQ